MSQQPKALESLWLEDEVNKKYLHFSKKHKINIFLGTWNVNAKAPKDDIDSWLLHKNNFDPHMYVLGFQEIVDLNAANLWIENDANEGWEEKIQKCIGNQYELIASKHLVGILLVIFAKTSLKPHISDCIKSSFGCGLFGTAGNKGACAVHLKIFDTKVAFLSAHLAAHKNNVQGRNQDHLKIIENLEFNRNGDDDNDDHNDSQQHNNDGDHENQPNSGGNDNNHDNSGSNNSGNNNNNGNNGNNEYQFSALYGGERLSIREHHDMIFWIGDLNYRLNFDNLEHVYKKVDDGDWKYLLSKDQLIEERQSGRSFKEFVEADISFQPTYKFQPGTNLYEKRPDKKRRFPAWCDRILWKKGKLRTSHINDVKCLKYECSMNQVMSDHKPVYAFIEFMVNEYDLTKKKQVRTEIMLTKDRKVNNMLPQITIPRPDVSFPSIKYGQEYRKEFVIENSGKVPARFQFDKQQMPSWLNIDPNEGVVLHQVSRIVNFKITVSADNVAEIMSKNNKMEATVLLVIEHDVTDDMKPTRFVTVNAEYVPSCFGNKIENLVKYKQPIRFIEFSESDGNDNGSRGDNQSKDSGQSGGGLSEHKQQGRQDQDGTGGDDDDGANGGTQVLSLPKELWRLVDHLYKYGMDTEDIFLKQGPTKEISDIRECLDTGKEFGRYELHSVGEALVRFLESTQKPIFPASLCDSFKANSNMNVTQWCRQALINLPLSHYNAFIYVVSFLREVLKHSQRNKLTPEKLGMRFILFVLLIFVSVFFIFLFFHFYLKYVNVVVLTIKNSMSILYRVDA